MLFLRGLVFFLPGTVLFPTGTMKFPVGLTLLPAGLLKFTGRFRGFSARQAGWQEEDSPQRRGERREGFYLNGSEPRPSAIICAPVWENVARE